jgi:hypothetical protein
MQKLHADFRRVVSLLVLTTALTLAAYAQNYTNELKNDSTEKSVKGAVPTDDVIQVDDNLDKKNEFAVWGAFAPDIPRVFGGSRRSTFGEIGLRYSRRIATTENLALKYQIDLIPLAIINYERERLIPGIAPMPVVVDRSDQTAYALGLTPVNFQLNFRRRAKIQPFITVEAGLLIFNKKIPDDRSVLRPNQIGRRLNFTPAGGGGVEFATGDARSYTVGFKFNHISNSSTGNINPGFDQSLFYFGYTFKKF